MCSSDLFPSHDTPVYEGGISGEIEIGEVVSTSATEIQGNEPLGTLAGIVDGAEDTEIDDDNDTDINE